MAQIKLNVELNSEKAKKGIEVLKENIKSLTKDLENVTPNKDLTKQIKALADYYKTVVKAGQQAVNVRNKEQLAAIKLETAQKKLNILTEKEIQASEKSKKARTDAAIAEEKLAQAIAKTSKALSKNTEETKENNEAVKKGSQSVMDMAKKFLKWQLAATIVMQPLNALKSLLMSIVNIQIQSEEKAIELEKVLPEMLISRKEMISDINGLAYQTGRNFEEATEIAINFARAGYEYNDVLLLTRAGLLAMNVAELDATQASEGLISVLTQFNLGATHAIDVIDKLNEVSNNYPVSAEKLIKALQRTGSAAANANLTIDQTIGLITALSKATGRSGENLGTAVNSLIQYSSKNSALDTFAGLSKESSNVVSQYRAGAASILDVWRQVSREINSLSAEQADMLDAYFNTADGSDLKQQLSSELAGVYDELGGVYDTANTFRKNYFIALLKNIETVDDAAKKALGSSGSALKENEKYMASFTAKLNQLKAVWHELANDDNGVLSFLKSIVSIATTTLEIEKIMSGLHKEARTWAQDTFTNLFGNETAGHWVGAFLTDLIDPKAALNDVATFLEKATDEIGDYFNLSFKEIKGIADEEENVVVETDKWVNSLEHARAITDDVVKSFQEYRKELKETNDLEEKKLAVIEAQKALEDARSQTNVRVFNARTGLFEYQANIKDVQSAEEQLLQAQTELEESAYAQIEKDIEQGNLTNAGILALLADMAPRLAPDSTFSDTVKSFLKKTYNVDIDQPEQYIPAPSSGIELSNNEFAKLILEKGLWGAVNDMMTKKYVYANSLPGAITGGAGIINQTKNQSNTTNNNYTVNGIPISEQSAGSKTMREIFREMELVP